MQRVSECESWYFVGPPPAEGGRRPYAEAAASPQGWPPPKTSLFIQKVFDCKWYYLSIGEAEDYRYYWRPEWKIKPPPWLDKENPNWPGNYKVKYWYSEWQDIILDYTRRIVEAGFDGAYLDIIDAFAYYESK